METTYKGETSYGVCEKPEIKKKAEAIKEFNKILAKAAPLAMKAWKEDDETKKISFPLRSFSPARIKVLKTYMDKEKAEAYLKAYLKKLEEKQEKEQAALAKKLEAMNEKQREKYEEQQKKLEEQKQLIEQAYALIDKKCEEVKAEIEKKKAEKTAKK
jgi:hypothetical protein